ncbi:calcium-binding tyrosine phosphorylation-regulated protein [Athene noctua]|uniref:calcium-binding tyrosine phosphorylation-regulated protein n=1 Tax=Athene noctua TaxID=126797 RepID=UPI003EBC5B23
MQSSKISLTVPCGLQTLLEGVSRAVIEDNPDNIVEFFALYFQDLVTFQKGHPNLDLIELVEKFELMRVMTSENSSVLSSDDISDSSSATVLGLHIGQRLLIMIETRPLVGAEIIQFYLNGNSSCVLPLCALYLAENENKRLEEKTSEYTVTLFSGEPKRMDKCTDIEEDQLLEEPDIQYSSRVTQHPSTASSIVGSSSPPGFDGASSPEGPELVYVPAEFAAHVLAMASSEAGQLQPHSNVWTLYCLTDLRQGQESPPSFPPAGVGGPYYQATLSLSRGEDQQWGQLSHVSAPIYVMQEGSKRENAPPFILVGPNIQNTQDWKPLPSHAGARRRFIAVPVARPAAEEMDMASCNSQSAEETGAKPCTAHVLSVAIPLDDVMSAKKGSAAGDKRTGINALAGHITVTPGPVPRAGS